MIEFDDQSKLHIHEIDFEPLHPVRLIEGKFRDLIYQAKETPSEDYVYLSVLDEEPITDLAARFRYFYPRLLEVRTPHFEYSASNYRSLSESPGNLSISQLFEQFHFEETGKNITDEDQALIQKLEQKLRHS